MTMSGATLYLVLVFLLFWAVLLFFLSRASLKLLQSGSEREHFRLRLTLIAMCSTATGVFATFLFCLTWISPDVSQYLGVSTLRVISHLIIWPSLAGLTLSLFGIGKVRAFSMVSSSLVSVWWLALVIGSGISMGPPLARHPVRYLIPEGYVGWVEIRPDPAGTPVLIDGFYVYKIPVGGRLTTPFADEEGWARDEYFYYAPDGAQTVLKQTGWGEGGLIWGQTFGYESDQNNQSKFTVMRFFVGPEEQFRHSAAQ
jgi:hypothetical protein